MVTAPPTFPCCTFHPLPHSSIIAETCDGEGPKYRIGRATAIAPYTLHGCMTPAICAPSDTTCTSAALSDAARSDLGWYGKDKLLGSSPRLISSSISCFALPPPTNTNLRCETSRS